jgi:hypothetical protein
MKQIISIVILILVFCFAASAQDESNLPVCILPVAFDIYGEISPIDEKARLDNLFVHISTNKDLKTLIVLKLSKSKSQNRKIKRLNEIAKYMNFRKIDKTKFTLAILEDEEEETTFWVEPMDLNLEQLLSGETTNYKLIKTEEFEQKIKELFPKK